MVLEDGNSLNITELAATEMTCEEPLGVMEQEQRYLQALTGEVAGYQRTADRLILLNGAGETVLEFRW
jgi:heat shock protein HslJ